MKMMMNQIYGTKSLFKSKYSQLRRSRIRPHIQTKSSLTCSQPPVIFLSQNSPVHAVMNRFLPSTSGSPKWHLPFLTKLCIHFSYLPRSTWPIHPGFLFRSMRSVTQHHVSSTPLENTPPSATHFRKSLICVLLSGWYIKFHAHTGTILLTLTTTFLDRKWKNKRQWTEC